MMHNDAKPHSARAPRLPDLSPNDNVCCIMKWTVEQLKLPNNLLTNGCYSCMFNFKLLADVSDMSDPLNFLELCSENTGGRWMAERVKLQTHLRHGDWGLNPSQSEW